MKKNLPAMPPGAKPPVPAQHGRGTVRTLSRATSVVDKLANKIIPYDHTHLGSPDQRARPTIMVGLTLMFALFGVILVWAALVPLSTGAVAKGVVVVDSSRKEIQHLEGGIVKEILVKEGDTVTEGQLLVRLDATSAQARSEQLRGQYLNARAAAARLEAERDGKDSVTFADELTAQEASDTKVREAMDTQRRLFATHRAALTGAVSVYNQKIAQSADEIRGLREQVNSSNQQIALLDEEIKTVSGLLSAGNATKPRLLALKRQQADLMGQRGNAEAMIARAEQTINESKIDILNQKTAYLNQAVSDLKDVQVQLSDLTEQLRTATDVTSRIDMKAPIAGQITGLAIHTVGGVVKPGETLMSIVPSHDQLIVEVHVQPTDIEVVHPGLEAQVRVLAFKQRFLRPMKGTVTTVSTDRFEDQRSGEAYFTARIAIPQEQLGTRGMMKLTAGMSAEALIVTGNRTMLSYLIYPIRESFGHAFRER